MIDPCPFFSDGQSFPIRCNLEIQSFSQIHGRAVKRGFLKLGFQVLAFGNMAVESGPFIDVLWWFT